jgi:hypothetical protein
VPESQRNVRILHEISDFADRRRFQWVKLQLTFFLRATPQIVLISDFERQLVALEKKPLANAQELNKIYDTILERNSPEASDGRTVTTFIFQWMICSFRLLDMGLVMEALSVLQPSSYNEVSGQKSIVVTPKQIARLVQNLVIINGDLMSFAHASVSEYLETRHPVDFVESHCHARMASMSVRFLMDPPGGVFSQHFELMGNSLRQRPGLPRSRPNSTWPYYALGHFMAHCTAAAEELRQSLGIDSLLVKWIVDRESPVTLSQWLSFQVPVSAELIFVMSRRRMDIAEALLLSPKHVECCLSPNVLSGALDLAAYDSRLLEILVAKIIELYPNNDDLISEALMSVRRSHPR